MQFRTPARQGDWLHNLPPFRGPRQGGGIGYLIALMLFAELWIFELELWLSAWCCYTIFLGLRWVVDAIRTKRSQQPVPVDPYARPIDLAATRPYAVPGDPYTGMGLPEQPPADPWDTGGMRRRS
jgi:hypothetical protein